MRGVFAVQSAVDARHESRELNKLWRPLGRDYLALRSRRVGRGFLGWVHRRDPPQKTAARAAASRSFNVQLEQRKRVRGRGAFHGTFPDPVLRERKMRLLPTCDASSCPPGWCDLGGNHQHSTLLDEARSSPCDRAFSLLLSMRPK